VSIAWFKLLSWVGCRKANHFGPKFHLVGQISGKAEAFDFLPGTVIEGEEGFADCADNSSPAIPPALSER
jgi:hypothetical protein